MRTFRISSRRSVALALGLVASPFLVNAEPPRASAGTATATQGGLDLDGMDKAVLPGNDFFRYTNGTWLRTAEIPADRSSYGAGTIVSELTNKRTADLIQELARTKAPEGSDAQKVGDAYQSFLDEAAIEAKGL
ncbi:MAG: M13 family peptidase, partial [Acidobacteria bacterium]|nr:M13 family peptidase [Acidobacteriota bacterium]